MATAREGEKKKNEKEKEAKVHESENKLDTTLLCIRG
jgi:hypothetical protein